MAKDYWVERADKRMSDVHKQSDGTLEKIFEAYDSAIDELNHDIDKIFGKYIFDTGISEKEALKLLNENISRDELDKIRVKLGMIENEEIKIRLKNKLSASLVRQKITRLEALKEDIYIQVSRMADVELKHSTSRYVDIVQNEFLRNTFDVQQLAGFAYSFSKIPEKVVAEILKDDWSGKHYSRRIWENAEITGGKIESTIKELLLKGSLTGSNSRKLAKELKSITGVSKYACERLIRTESTYFTAMADMEAAKQRGTKYLKFVATLDNRTSKECREHDGRKIKIEDAVPGKTIPPLHPFCRSVVIDVIEGLEHKVRRARDEKTGNNILVPANMTYKEWKDKYVDTGCLDAGNDNIWAGIDTTVDIEYVNSEVYAKKFKNLTGSEAADEKLLELSREILKRNSGTRTEELYFIDKSSGKIIEHLYGRDGAAQVRIPKSYIDDNRFKDKKVVTLHNHPSGSAFSIADIRTNSYLDFVDNSVVAGHNGYVYHYTNMNYSKEFEEWYNKSRENFIGNVPKGEAGHTIYSLGNIFWGSDYERR